MGGTHSEGTTTQVKLDHYCLRNCKALTTSKGTTLLATMPTQKPTYEKWKEELQQQEKVLTSKKCLLWPLEHAYDQGGVCSTTGELKLQYDYYPRLLENQMKLRKKDNKRFEESELWYLLDALVDVKSTFAQIDQCVGDIHPRNIFLNAEQEVKIACLLSWPGQVNNYRKVKMEEDWGYLAPEDMERLKLGAMDNKINTQSQIFAIGLVLLAASTNNINQDIYKMRDEMFDFPTFASRVNRFQHDFYYSEIYRGLVCNLLEIEPAKRLNIEQLKIFLFKHKPGIAVRKSLLIDNVPKKLQISVNEMLKNITVAKMQQMYVPPIGVNGYHREGGSGKPAQSNLSIALNMDPSQVNLADVIHQNISQNGISSRPETSKQVPLYQPINQNQDPVRPNINKIFSSQALASPRGSQTEIAAKNKPFQQIEKVLQGEDVRKQQTKQKQPIFIKESNVQKIVTEHDEKANPTEVWQKNQSSMMGQLNNLMMETGKKQFIDKKQTRKEEEKPQQIKNNYKLAQVEVKVQENGHEQIAKLQQAGPLPSQTNEVGEKEEKKNQEIKDEKPSVTLDQEKKQFKEIEKINENIEAKVEKIQEKIEAKAEEIIQGKTEEKVEGKGEEKEKTQIQQQYDLKKSQNEKNAEQKIDEIVKKQSQVKNIIDEKIEQLREIVNEKLPDQAKIKEEQGVDKKESNNIESQKKVNDISNVDKKDEAEDSKKIKQGHSSTEVVYRTNGAERKENIITLDSATIVPNDPRLAPVVKLWGKPSGQIKKESVSQQLQVKKEQIAERKLEEKEIVDAKKQINAEQDKSKHEVKEENSKVTENASDIAHLEATKNAIKEEVQDVSNVFEKNVDELKKNVENIQKKVEETIENEENNHYHTYVDVATQASYDACWDQLLKMLADPSTYFTVINRDKVTTTRNEDEWQLKVGPAVLKIDTNKEEGKILLSSFADSRCQGQILGGVFKDEAKLHRIWVNSALTYKGQPFPEKSFWENGFTVAKTTLDNASN